MFRCVERLALVCGRRVRYLIAKWPSLNFCIRFGINRIAGPNILLAKSMMMINAFDNYGKCINGGRNIWGRLHFGNWQGFQFAFVDVEFMRSLIDANAAGAASSFAINFVCNFSQNASLRTVFCNRNQLRCQSALRLCARTFKCITDFVLLFLLFAHSLLSCAVGSGHNTLYNSHNYTYELPGFWIFRVQFFRNSYSPSLFFIPCPLSIGWLQIFIIHLFIFFSHLGGYLKASFFVFENGN